jgi:hypothetical protein
MNNSHTSEEKLCSFYPDRVIENEFQNGQYVNFDFSFGEETEWNPSKSFFKIKGRFTDDEDGAMKPMNKEILKNFALNLFTKIQFSTYDQHGNSVEIEKCEAIPQVSTINSKYRDDIKENICLVVNNDASFEIRYKPPMHLFTRSRGQLTLSDCPELTKEFKIKLYPYLKDLTKVCLVPMAFDIKVKIDEITLECVTEPVTNTQDAIVPYIKTGYIYNTANTHKNKFLLPDAQAIPTPINNIYIAFQDDRLTDIGRGNELSLYNPSFKKFILELHDFTLCWKGKKIDLKEILSKQYINRTRFGNYYLSIPIDQAAIPEQDETSNILDISYRFKNSINYTNLNILLFYCY